MEAFSHSRAWVYQGCKQRYSYKYSLRIKPLAKDAHLDQWERFTRGTLIHAALEGILKGHDPAKYVADVCAEERARGLRQEQEDLLALLEPECLQIALNFADWLPLSDWELVHDAQGNPLSEYELRLPLQSGVGEFLGYVDCVLRHKETGRLLVCDFKSKANLGKDGDENFVVQLPMYIYALRQLGIVDTNMYALLELKSSLPKRAPRKVRFDMESIDTVRESVDGCFKYVPKYCSDAYLENTWRDFETLCKSMSRFSHEYAYRSRNSYQCNTCEFKLLCEAQLTNSDVNFIAKNNFKTPPASLLVLQGNT